LGEIVLAERALAWNVTLDDVIRSGSSTVAFGRRDQLPVVLKVDAPGGDERFVGRVLEAFGGRGVARVLEHDDGAVLLERIVPGTPLANAHVDDDEATKIIAEVIKRMSPEPAPGTTPTVEAWGSSFERDVGATSAIPRALVEAARATYTKLCASQQSVRLLHGDLHHRNVLLDAERGWVAIDPKGVVGELAYEVGAALRNPCERPELFAAPMAIEARVKRFSRALRLDSRRILAWAFAQAVLAALWEWEDDGVLTAGAGWIALAKSLQTMTGSNLG
jgi:streptomycin 6-kinase